MLTCTRTALPKSRRSLAEMPTPRISGGRAIFVFERRLRQPATTEVRTARSARARQNRSPAQSARPAFRLNIQMSALVHIFARELTFSRDRRHHGTLRAGFIFHWHFEGDLFRFQFLTEERRFGLLHAQRVYFLFPNNPTRRTCQ